MTIADEPLTPITDIKPGEVFILPDEPARGVCLRMLDHNGAASHPEGTYLYVSLDSGAAGYRDSAAVGVIVNYECRRVGS